MIQRDRNMQRLGLHCVEELPKPGGWQPEGSASGSMCVSLCLVVRASEAHNAKLRSHFTRMLAAAVACGMCAFPSELTAYFPPAPFAVLAEVVQDACALLECRQPLELCAAIKPVQDLAALVPRMERFIGDVCGVRGIAGPVALPLFSAPASGGAACYPVGD